MLFRSVVLNFHAYLDSSPGNALKDRAFLNAWKNSLSKAKDKNNLTWLDDAMEILQEAVTNSWDFREAFYAFCDAISVKAQPKALVDV